MKKDPLFEAWRKAVLDRDERTCRMCGDRPVGRRLHTHHIKPRKERPDLIYDIDNGMTLCVDCHIKIEPPMAKEEARVKMRQSLTGRVLSEECRAKISKVLTGRPRPEWVRVKLRKPKKPRTEEHKKNLAAACKGRKMPVMNDSTKDKIRQAMLGRKFSPETLKRMSDGQKRRFHGAI